MTCVSVVIPAHNAAQCIALTIQSVLAQTYKDFELIVVDDQSTDDTLKVLGRFSDDRLRIISNPQRLGLAGNWNAAVAAAQGKYIKLLCQDDLIYPDCLQSQVSVLECPENASVSMVCCLRDIIDVRGEVKFRNRGFRNIVGKMDRVSALRAIVRSGTNPVGEPEAVLIRSDALKKAGGFDTASDFMIDVDMWCRLLDQGDLYVIPRTLCAFRVWEGSLSLQMAGKHGRQAGAFFSRMPARHPDAVTHGDACIGRAKALIWSMARHGLYRWYFPKPATADIAPPLERIEVKNPRWFLRGVVAEHLRRYEFVRQYAGQKQVLDVACGSGYGSAMLAEVAQEVIGIDKSDDAIRAARVEYSRPNIRFLVGDASRLPLPSGSIDLAASFETIEHLPFDLVDQYLAELSRVVKPGGMVIISTPDKQSYSMDGPTGNPHHQFEFTMADFLVRVGAVFEVKEVYGQEYAHRWVLRCVKFFARGPMFALVARLWRAYKMVLLCSGRLYDHRERSDQVPMYVTVVLKNTRESASPVPGL